ncbi:hypothetical protein [Streptomyces sp. BK340]|uniref:hypothetical protein n=1 Tax=Streptomyces sp. BK340 TaxID=2572903 RepID=UPI0011AD1416|nr:hypothetical protein [Streptomyces sp. BK340]TVZ84852.1 hypothetical protein FB157_120119 [Streptomyces sp. BK340]
MTAAVASAASVQINVDLIRRTYSTVLGEPRIGRPDLGSDEQRAHLAGLLRGQLRVLVLNIEGQVTVLRGETRHTAMHVITRAREALAVGFADARDPEHLHDLATLTRSLLTLHDLAARSLPLSTAPSGSGQQLLPPQLVGATGPLTERHSARPPHRPGVSDPPGAVQDARPPVVGSPRCPATASAAHLAGQDAPEARTVRLSTSTR